MLGAVVVDGVILAQLTVGLGGYALLPQNVFRVVLVTGAGADLGALTTAFVRPGRPTSGSGYRTRSRGGRHDFLT
ncbi:hypothetical protein [Kribbella turkmenica]|nr:hypothetical protein [Kribbella turkmenica]